GQKLQPPTAAKKRKSGGMVATPPNPRKGSSVLVHPLLAVSPALVPRLCLGTHYQRGSASSSIAPNATIRRSAAPGVQLGRRSLRGSAFPEPGNEGNRRSAARFLASASG